jgi:hypothetical protein
MNGIILLHYLKPDLKKLVKLKKVIKDGFAITGCKHVFHF